MADTSTNSNFDASTDETLQVPRGCWLGSVAAGLFELHAAALSAAAECSALPPPPSSFSDCASRFPSGVVGLRRGGRLPGFRGAVRDSVRRRGSRMCAQECFWPCDERHSRNARAAATEGLAFCGMVSNRHRGCQRWQSPLAAPAETHVGGAADSGHASFWSCRDGRFFCAPRAFWCSSQPRRNEPEPGRNETEGNEPARTERANKERATCRK
jgi:hypothetical protein